MYRDGQLTPYYQPAPATPSRAHGQLQDLKRAKWHPQQSLQKGEYGEHPLGRQRQFDGSGAKVRASKAPFDLMAPQEPQGKNLAFPIVRVPKPDSVSLQYSRTRNIQVRTILRPKARIGSGE